MGKGRPSLRVIVPYYTTHVSTPAIEFPRTPGPLQRPPTVPFPQTTQLVNPQLARRLSQRGLTSSTASNEVTIVERSVGIDLYTYETRICGTSQFIDESAHDQLASLAFTANDSALLPEEEVEIPGQGNVDEAGFTPFFRKDLCQWPNRNSQ